MIRDEVEIIYVARAETEAVVKAYGSDGDRAPAQCVATGNILLAALPWYEVDSLLPAFTPSSVTDRAVPAEELRQVGRRGYALNRIEWRGEVNGIAVLARRAPAGVPVAAGISAPTYRLPSDTVLSLLSVLRRVAVARGSDRCRRRIGAFE